MRVLSKTTFFIPLFITFLAVTITLSGQTTKTVKKHVSLDTLLSCPSDELVKTVFQTDWRTAVHLNALLMSESRKSKDMTAEDASKGFVTFPVADREVLIKPTDINGKTISNNQLSFCNYLLSANYTEDDTSKPYSVDVSGDGWILNPNEVFSHADQFEFKSGVFTTSSKVFLVATRGRVAIQFICSQTGLTLYRAIYYPPEPVR